MRSNIIIKSGLTLFKSLLSVRYKVDVTGLELLKTDRPKLFLPNHQAIVDPILIMSQIYRVSSAVPVVTEGYYNLPILKSILTNWGAISVSDLESGSRDTTVLDEVTTKSLDSFKRGENVIIYPSGQLAGQGYEKIFNKQGAWHIALAMPKEAQIIGVRINGLWGSQWSKAWSGKSPNFGLMVLRSFAFTFMNLLIFAPKRTVTIEFCDITEEAKLAAGHGKVSFNNHLESFYNSKGEERVSFIKHLFFQKKSNRTLPSHIVGSVNDMKELISAKTEDDIPPATLKGISKIISNVLKIDESKISLGSNLMLDLGCDSLNLVEVVAEMEQQFPKVEIPEITAIRTVSDLCLATMGLLEAKIVHKKQYFNLPIKNRQRIKVDKDIDIVTQFINRVKESPNEWFVYDEMIGSTKRSDFLLKAIVVSEIIKKSTKSEYVGVMLPALQSSTLLILSIYLAGKKPVMLNWTVGNKVLEHCIEVSEIDTIISAEKFIKKIADQLPKSIENKLLLLEKEVKKVSIGTKLQSVIKSKLPSLFIKPIHIDETAVILFTSGSEDLPKAVPLTHKNIVSNLASVFDTINLTNDLIFVGFLPPFHSFGFTVLSIFPLLSGVRVGYTPDPTDGKTIAKLISHLGANVILGSPSFLKIILSNGSKNDFKTLKYAISGAEAMPLSLIELFDKATHNAKLIEGYGITECSPIISLNPLEKQKRNSVGRFISQVDGMILKLETNQRANPNEEGMIYVSGDNIFNGYQNHPSNPFEYINDKKYYKTGDLGYVDDEGYLFITGRLKRFIKIGGEMISLPFIEKVLLEKYGNSETQTVAVEGSDKTQPPRIALFSTIEISQEEANQYLIQNGVSPLGKVKEIIRIEEMPLLGSGKIDYKQLRKRIEE